MKVVIKKTKINYKENIKNIYKELTLYIYIYILHILRFMNMEVDGMATGRTLKSSTNQL